MALLVLASLQAELLHRRHLAAATKAGLSETAALAATAELDSVMAEVCAGRKKWEEEEAAAIVLPPAAAEGLEEVEEMLQLLLSGDMAEAPALGQDGAAVHNIAAAAGPALNPSAEAAAGGGGSWLGEQEAIGAAAMAGGEPVLEVGDDVLGLPSLLGQGRQATPSSSSRGDVGFAIRPSSAAGAAAGAVATAVNEEEDGQQEESAKVGEEMELDNGVAEPGQGGFCLDAFLA